MRSQDRRVGMVYQHAALFEHKSPLDNVALAVRDIGVAAARVIAAELLERVGVAALATAKTRSLSGGERQRVALARALAGDARVLLLDEPFSSLDATARQAMRKLVRSLVDERGVIALLVTHDAQDVDALADRVVAYEPGRTVAATE
jgi:ABC-type sulfate/molybdate transport systems ATPase subunit